MSILIKKTLVKIAFYIFILNVTSMLMVIVYELAWEVIAITWVVLSILVVLLLLVTLIPMRYKTKYEKDNAHNQNNSIHHKKFKYIVSNIRLWINSCFGKSLKIIYNIYKTNSIKSTDNSTNNHSFHTDKIPQELGQVNHKQTEPFFLLQPIDAIIIAENY